MMNGHMMPMMSAPPYAPPDPQDIVGMVKQHYDDVSPLRVRMENDYNLYRLVPHVNRDRVTGQPLLNYATFTSSSPKYFADKVISWQTLAELMPRVPHMDPGQHTEEADNAKERFFIGNLRAAGERRARLMEPPLRSQLATFVTVRGGYAGGRALLANRLGGTCYADITAWDPMHIHWGLGPDGLSWGAYRIKLTRQQMRDEYGYDVLDGKKGFSFFGFRPKGSTDAEKEGVWVVDWYDGTVNTVVTEDREVLKGPARHGSPRVPVYLTLVGNTPLLQSEAAQGLIADVGESVYSAAREVYAKKNDVLSIMQEIVERARKRAVLTKSQSGTKVLPSSIYDEDVEIGMRVGEEVTTLELQEMARETMPYLTNILAEEQRATVPNSTYGETAFQLSGYAINQLRQAIETVLASRLQALEGMYLQQAHLLYDQFMTGDFNSITLSGVDSNRNYFNAEITPEMMTGSCDYTVKLVSQLPQDDQAKVGMAVQLKQSGLLSDSDIREGTLGLQDAKQAGDKLRDQKAEEGLPEAQLYTLGLAAAERGDMIVARMYVMAFDALMFQKYNIQPPAGGTQLPQKSGATQPAKPTGPLPQNQPYAATGAPPPRETSNNGPAMVAPGTPRPGAQGQSA